MRAAADGRFTARNWPLREAMGPSFRASSAARSHISRILPRRWQHRAVPPIRWPFDHAAAAGARDCLTLLLEKGIDKESCDKVRDAHGAQWYSQVERAGGVAGSGYRGLRVQTRGQRRRRQGQVDKWVTKGGGRAGDPAPSSSTHEESESRETQEMQDRGL